MTEDGGAAHVLDLHGTGHYSKGNCTGCDWAYKGHADEIRRVWESYHSDGKVVPIPQRVPVPPPTGRPEVDKIERRIIVVLSLKVDIGLDSALLVAVGLAEARAILLGTELAASRTYVSIVMARIAHMSKRKREKLRHPARSRAEQQALLDE